MYDLEVLPIQSEICVMESTTFHEKNMNDICVLVGDNITIQEQPQKEEQTKKVRFMLPETDVSANFSLSLFSVEPSHGTSYDEGMPASAPMPVPAPPPTKNSTETEQFTWKQRVAMKSCFFFLISLPFIMVAIIQPWNDGTN